MKKVWSGDNDNESGNRPETITVNLLAGGEVKQTATVKASDNWEYTFENLAKYENGEEIQYTVSEEAVKNYALDTVAGNAAEGYIITNKYAPETTEVNVTKVWEDEDNQNSNRPAEIVVKLFANEEEAEIARLNAEGTWKHTFKDLPVYEDGMKINYTVEEVEVAGYTTSINERAESDFVITNTLETINVSGVKTWVDNYDEAGARPESITISLTVDDEPYGSKVVTSVDGWKWDFGELPRYINGKLVSYKITEETVTSYETEIIGFDVTNTYVKPVEPTASPNPTEEPVEPTASPNPTEEPVEPTVSPNPTEEPVEPTASPNPTEEPVEPTASPNPTEEPIEPTASPVPTVTPAPTATPKPTASPVPTMTPSPEPTKSPVPTVTPAPTSAPTEEPTAEPTSAPTAEPSEEPTAAPTEEPSSTPTEGPTAEPTSAPTAEPSEEPTTAPTEAPTVAPTAAPTEEPSVAPTEAPTAAPTTVPTSAPVPTQKPIVVTTPAPTKEPVEQPVIIAPTNPTPIPEYDISVPKTDDEAPVGLWFALMMSSLAGMIVVCICAYRRQKNEYEE